MKKNGALDIICKIFSVLFSIILVASLIVTVIFSSVTNLIKPDTLTEIISDIDFSEFLSDSVGSYTAQNIKKGGATLAFTSLMSSAYTVTDESAQNAPDSYVNFQGSNNGESQYTVDENGNIVYNGEVVGNVTDSVGNDSSTSIIGGADGPTSVIVGEPSVDLSQFGIPEIPGVENPMEIVDDFMESDTAKEILGEYTSAVNDALQGKESQVDKERIKEIIIENKEEIIDYVEKYAGQQVDRQQLSDIFDQVVNENIDEVLSILPEPNEIVKAVPVEVINVLNIINSGIILNALITINAFLIIAIFIMRLWDFAGFLWLSVDGIVAGVILTFVYLIMNFAKGIILGALPVGRSIFEAVFNSVLNRMLIAFLIILLVSAIFMVIFFVIKNFRKKKSEAK